MAVKVTTSGFASLTSIQAKSDNTRDEVARQSIHRHLFVMTDLPALAVPLFNKLPKNSNAPLLVAFMAACCHPDYVTNISMLANLPADERAACLQLASAVLNGAWSIDDSSTVLAALLPWLLSVT